MLDSKRFEQDGRANGIYIARFRNLTTKQEKFIRGYGFQGGAGQPLWEQAKGLAGFGSDLKKAVRDYHPWGIGLGGFGECLPRMWDWMAGHLGRRK